VGTDTANAAEGGNVQGLAALIFSRYVIAFETTAALLITAAVAAMVMAHPERLRKKPGQTERAAQRLSKYAEAGVHLGADPASGVFARHNSVATPALLPDGSVASRSVSSVIADRVAIAAPEDLWAPHDEVLIAIDQAKDVEFDEELGLIDSDPGIAAHELDLFADGQSQPAIDDAVAGPPTEVTAEFETVVARPADPSSRPQTQPPDPTDLKLATSKASTTDDAPATSDAEDGYTPANTGEEEDND
jgi:hypothetical protein